MPAHRSNSENHEQHPAETGDRPLSRRERRGKQEKQQPLHGVRNPGRVAVPASKHVNYRRG